MTGVRPDESHPRGGHRPRFRLLSLLVGVTLIALALGIWKYWQLQPETAVVYLHLDRRAVVALSEPDGLSAERRLALFKEAQSALVRTPLVLERVLRRPEIAELPILAKRSNKMAFLQAHLSATCTGDRMEIRLSAVTDEPYQLVRIVGQIGVAYSVISYDLNKERAERLMQSLEEERDMRNGNVERLRTRVRELASGGDANSSTVAVAQEIGQELAAEQVLLDRIERRLDGIRAYQAGPVSFGVSMAMIADD